MTLLDEKALNNTAESGNDTSVVLKESATTSLAKDELETILGHYRDYATLLRQEYLKDNPGEIFSLDPEIRGLRERIKSILDGTVIENYIFWREGDGWRIGRESNPIFIKTRSKESFQYLHSLINLFPKYNPQKSAKGVGSIQLVQLADIALGVKGKAGDVIDPYSVISNLGSDVVFATNDNDEEQEQETQEILQDAADDKVQVDADLREELEKDVEVDLGEIEDALIKAEDEAVEEGAADRNKITDLKDKLEQAEIDENAYSGGLDYEAEDDDLPPGSREQGSTETWLASEGLEAPINDTLGNPRLPTKARKAYEKELTKLKEERIKLKDDANMLVLTGNREKMAELAESIEKNQSDINIVKIHLGRPRVDEKDGSSQVNKIRNTVRKGIKAAVTRINQEGEEGKKIATLLKERLITTDPFSYEARKDDPPWVTQKP